MKEQYSLEEGLELTLHHVAASKARRLIRAIEAFGLAEIESRFQLITDNLIAALQQLEKIRQTAERLGSSEIIRLLDEKTVPAGHDK